MHLNLVLRVALASITLLAVGGCASNVIDGMRTSGRWLLSQTSDRPEDADTHPGRNDASAYSQYQTERGLLLSSTADERRSIADAVRLRKRVLALAPIGTDIGSAKICLELNGFACAWMNTAHGAIGCGVNGDAKPLRVHIRARNHAVTQVAVTAPNDTR